MFYKKIILAILLATSVVSAKADSRANYFLFGAVVGAHLNQAPVVVYQQPPVYIQQSPYILYPSVPQPVIVTPSQYPNYDYRLHGYCAPYQGDIYAQCINNARYRTYPR